METHFPLMRLSGFTFRDKNCFDLLCKLALLVVPSLFPVITCILYPSSSHLSSLSSTRALAPPADTSFRTRDVVSAAAEKLFQPNEKYINGVSHTHSFREDLRPYTRVGTLIVATIYLQLIQNRYMFRSFTVLQCSHQHCVQPVASDVES